MQMRTECLTFARRPRDMADVRERPARLEGAVDILMKFLIDRGKSA